MRLILFSIMIFVSSLCMAQVPAELAGTVVGKEAELCGKVVSVQMSMTNNGAMRTTLSIGKRGDIVLMVDLPKWNETESQRNILDNMKHERERYLDSTVCVTGKVTLRDIPAVKNGMPYVVIDSPDKIRYK